MSKSSARDENAPAGRRVRAPQLRLWLYLGLGAATLGAFWPALRFPFVQDDWGWLLRFQTHGAAAVVGSILDFRNVLFYRPLAELYLYVMYLLFGANPLPVHIAAIAIHFATACLVVALMREIARDEVVAWASGFVYALAAAVVLEPLLWAVGIFDLGAMLFSLLAALLFIRGRFAWSTAAYAAACLCKEPAVSLPIVLLAYAMIAGPRDRAGRYAFARRGLAPMGPVLCVMIVLKMLGTRQLSLEPSNPYALALVGPHVPILLKKYLFTVFQAFVPFGATRPLTLNVVSIVLLLLVAAALLILSRRGRPERTAHAYWFFLIWFAIELVPVLFMRNRGYRYYTIYALPAFIAAMFIQLGVICGFAGFPRPYARGALACIAAAAAVFSAIQARAVLGEGLEPRTLAAGTNNLVRKAALTEITHSDLLRLLPAPPPGAIIVLGGMARGALGLDIAPRVWYHDPSIEVFQLEDLEVDSTGIHFKSGPEGGVRAEKERIEPSKLFGFMLKGRKLLPIKFTGMPQPAVKPEPERGGAWPR
jgi:hypothetical protein